MSMLLFFPAVARADVAVDVAVPRYGNALGEMCLQPLVLFGLPAAGTVLLLTALFAKRKKGWLVWGCVLLAISAVIWLLVFA